jgi:hypothetical protein
VTEKPLLFGIQEVHTYRGHVGQDVINVFQNPEAK